MRFLFFIILLVSSSALHAQTASIRAGEHAEFSRLVVSIPVGSEWDVARIADGYAMRIENIDGFEFDAVFDRIPRDRILDLDPMDNSSGLSILSDCDCHVSAFLWRPDRLVVDIRDGSAPEEVPSDDEFQEPVQIVDLPVLTQQRPIERPSLELKPREPAGQNQRDLLEGIISAGIGRATSQGLLEPAKKIEPTQPPQFDAHILQNSPGLLAHTSFDRPVEPNTDQACLADSLFDVSRWGSTDVSYHDHIAELRGAIVGEFDQPDPQAVERLAKGFLYYGFGREARNALSIDQKKSAERNVLITISEIVDGDIVSNPISQNADCTGPASLWSFLSDSESNKANVDRNAVLRAFQALPLHLQTHLGPVMSQKFLQLGDTEAAEAALASSRFGLDLPIETELAQQELNVARGDAEGATGSLATLAESDTRMTPKALTDYFTLAVQSSTPVDPEALALADILRFENREAAQIGDLVAAQVEALIASGNEPRALGLLQEEQMTLGEERHSVLTAAALIAASKSFDDLAFLELAFKEDVVLASSDAQNQIAKRLISLGFPQRAGVLVAGSAVGSTMIERRYLRAEAALLRDDPDATLVHLLGQSSDRANKLRRLAELNIEGKEYISGDQGPTDWRLGDWASLLQGDDALLQDVSISVLDEQAVTLDRVEPLAQGRDMLAQSAKTRAMLDDLLARFAPIQN